MTRTPVLPLVLFLATAAAGWCQTTLLPAGSTWKYLDNGSNQGTAWRASAFDDSSWAQGPAQLGYGDGDEATVVSFGPTSTAKYITTYFRKSISVANPAAFTSLTLRARRDDGIVVYINGVEVWRDNMPTGTVQFHHAGNSRGLRRRRHVVQRPGVRREPCRRHERDRR